MTTTKDIAQMRITRDLRDAEKALDDLLLKQTKLFRTMIEMRRETDVTAFTGHETLMRLMKSQQTTLDAGSELARVHGKLLEIGRVEGVIDECPPNEPIRPGAERIAA